MMGTCLVFSVGVLIKMMMKMTRVRPKSANLMRAEPGGMLKVGSYSHINEPLPVPALAHSACHVKWIISAEFGPHQKIDTKINQQAKSLSRLFSSCCLRLKDCETRYPTFDRSNTRTMEGV